MTSRGWVFVTGASTGIGRAAVERLAADGFQTISGVRREGDQSPASAAHVLIDVADPTRVAAATAKVIELCAGKLAGLVNNAGISVAGPFEALTVDDYRRQFDINFFGQLDVTKHLMPSLLAAQGRIINIGSIGGKVSSSFLGAYAASKFAMRGWNDALRAELAPHGVKVILVQPGAIATEIWGKANADADVILDGMAPELELRYRKQIAGVRKASDMLTKNAIPAAKAAAAISKAMTSSRPKAQVIVGIDARLQASVDVLPIPASDKVFATILRAPKGS